ncbi:hypothetical protein [Quadrisphaera setariae]|uniref:Uncharacterized protein n=1 Tax=Quadrisphaera setariae TaxID=2593304 RepID=A0A5C8Z5E4_9ACTN|nr:hypothetical protein [Quadrisphaera setariae]TXR52408.1 hypothetical protein FMM08_19585 [Quadrisphaera setariae]
MGLTRARGPKAWLKGTALKRPRYLVVAEPGRDLTRLALERVAAERGWVMAHSPAEADALITCGPLSGELAAAAEVVWEQLPGPRARVDVDSPTGVESSLGHVLERLADDDFQCRDATTRPQEQPSDTGHAYTDKSDHGGMDQGGMDQGGMDQGGMDHGGMDMSGPGGIALASGGEDRDGLEMDVLHVQLGPVLGLWPSGLVVTVTLQGDVVVDAHAHHLDEAAAPERVDARVAACERAARILALAGSRYAAAAVRLRDALQMGTEVGSADTGRQIDLDGELAGLLARVQRSRTLRWSLRGLGDLKDDQIEKAGLPAGDQGDVHDRLIASLRLAADPVAAAPTSYGHRHRAVEALPSLLIGRELAEVRLTVASLDLESRGVFPEPEHGPDAGGADAAGGAVAAEAVA